MNTNRELSSIAQDVLSSPKTQTIVPVATSALAALQIWIPSILSLIAVCLGISVTLLVRQKTKKQIELIDVELQLKNEELERSHKRRKNDI